MLTTYDWKKSDEKTKLLSLLESRTTADESVADTVRDLILLVCKKGDEALIQATERYDGVDLSNVSLIVSKEEIDGACARVDKKVLTALQRAAKNIADFHQKQKKTAWFDTDSEGNLLGQLQLPIQRIGVYVPGGKAGSVPLVSSVLMNVIPAVIAGVPQIAVCTPPGKNGKVADALLAAAREAGAHQVYRVGGAQAIAAMAYGTKSIRKVDKIFGPGNLFVTTAKKLVYGTCGIDQLAGPSEILVFADQSADPVYVAADLLSQAEHDVEAACILITDCPDLVRCVQRELLRLVQPLAKADTAKACLAKYGCAVIVPDLAIGMDVVNEIAPEHLQIMTKEPDAWIPYVKNAGAVFLGAYAPEPVGDYFAGPNHVLPTSGAAKYSSVLNLDDFMKKTSLIRYTKRALLKNADDVMRLAQAEGLDAHANAIKVRLIGGESE